MHLLTKKYLSRLAAALKEFGTYSFDDKGLDEVMDIPEIVTELRTLSSTEAGDILTELARSPKHQGRGKQLANSISLELQDWDALFEHPHVEEFFE